MEMEKVTQYAHALFKAHGNLAEAEAAQKIRECAETGDDAQAETWRAVRAAIREIRGARQG